MTKHIAEKSAQISYLLNKQGSDTRELWDLLVTEVGIKDASQIWLNVFAAQDTPET